MRFVLPTALLAGAARASRSNKFPAWVSFASNLPSTSRTSSTCSAVRPSVNMGHSYVTETLGPQICSDGGTLSPSTEEMCRMVLRDQGTSNQSRKPFWRFFETISAVPRASYHETAILGYLKRFAEDHGLPWREDAMGNVVIERGGMNGGEDAPTVVIQGHVDMVAEKTPGSSHNFLEDPIPLMVDGDWLTADGTTLGADNGIGVAAALTLLDLPASSGVTLPPLECLFTVQEEVGLRGAFDLDASMIKGRTMLNLDTVEWGALFVGCAGGGESEITFSVEDDFVGATAYEPFRLTVNGLMGGHSGINIHEDRGNAIVLLVRVLESLREVVPTRVVGIKGGDKHNAIPREASAIVLLPTGDPATEDSAREAIARALAELKSEFGSKETALSVHLEEAKEDVLAATEGADKAVRRRCLGEDGTDRLLSLLQLLPHGVVKMSHDIKDLVETSSNLASIASMTDDTAGGDSRQGKEMFKIVCSTRSSIGSSLAQVRRQIKTAANVCGASEVKEPPAYPGWKPNLESNVLQAAKDALRGILDGKEPAVAALHAGLECGVIGDKIDGMDMVSFGPTVEGCHSPDERVNIKTVDGFWKLVVATLEVLGRSGSRQAAAN